MAGVLRQQISMLAQPVAGTLDLRDDGAVEQANFSLRGRGHDHCRSTARRRTSPMDNIRPAGAEVLYYAAQENAFLAAKRKPDGLR